MPGNVKLLGPRYVVPNCCQFLVAFASILKRVINIQIQRGHFMPPPPSRLNRVNMDTNGVEMSSLITEVSILQRYPTEIILMNFGLYQTK